MPFYLESYWLQIGLFAMAAAIGAIGLNLLSGGAGQLSLGHAFFLAVGAYGYAWLAGEPGPGLPAPLALVLAVCLAGVAGGVFSPVSGRVRGIYLGVATLALVFVGHHVMLNAEPVTGGYNGRSVAPFELGGFSFTSSDPELLVLGVPFGAEERLWYLALVLLAFAWFTARNILRGRPGRALAAVRDSEVAAAVMGVPVARYRSAAFVVSSMYAGLSGALIGLAFRRVVPDYFGLALSIDYLAMIVIGGLGSVAGAVAGAAFVTMLPLVMARYADVLPVVDAPGSGGSSVGPTEAARYLYGAAIILILRYAPGGLVGLFRRAPRAAPGGSGTARRAGPPDGNDPAPRHVPNAAESKESTS
ncbi:branched-chain amino acid ABC transporter permease [Streptomyces sp. TRM 70351]|uniref:branched-chain amino acid ABC transporter permease n=1 Tax=Streptomyces sp. TRM 70351 TaxID=3116552 RepID=UPI002E7C3508|nr:branched-chain amino acid ABC transporter permease [Streptomyces sp. TRM 70351]MEE1927879.1 branched-chain amino acid ABC transporter permease [Streptomyces sp. TRM 70351]